MTASTPFSEFGSLSDTWTPWDQLILMHDNFYTFLWIWFPIWHLQSVRSVEFDAWQLLHLSLNLVPHLTPAVCEISWFWCMTASTPFSEFGSPIWHLQFMRSVDFDAWLLLHLSLNLVPHLTPELCEGMPFWHVAQLLHLSLKLLWCYNATRATNCPNACKTQVSG